jgi:solute:Na+ symporter, SSS family
VHWIDGLVVALYLIFTLAMGAYLTRRVKSAKDFFLAGRKLSFWSIGMSVVVSDIGALEMVGGTAGAFQYGIAQANYEWIGCVPAMIIAALIFIPVYWRSGIFSVPEYLGRRYGAPVQAIEALVWTLFLAAALGVFFQAAAKMCAGLFGWEPWFSVALIGVIVAVYTIGGGLEAVVLTDVVQCVALFVGGLTLAGIGLHRVGGFGGLQQSLRSQGVRTEHHLKLLMPVDLKDGAGQPTGYPWSGILLGLGFVLSPAYWLGNQAIVQRTLGAKDEWSAKAAMIFGALLKTLVPLAFVLPGLLAIALWGDRPVADANEIYPQLINELLPNGLRGVLYAAFLAALMSSVDSYANSAATIVCRDIYQRFFVRDESDAHYLRVGRFISLTVIALGVAMVPVVSAYQTIYDAFQTFLSFFQGPSLALLLCGLLWRGATPTGGLVALVTGIAGAAMMHIFSDIHYLHMAWWSFLLSLVVLIVVSFVTKPLSADLLRDLMAKPGPGKGEAAS